MKKIYMIPTTQIVKIQTTQMIAISLYGTDATEAAMGRDGGDFWDDEDDDYDY